MINAFIKSIVLFFLPAVTVGFAQCLVPPPFPGCNPSGSVLLLDGASINTGQTHRFSGSATYANLTLNGGTLIVCGNLTLNAITVNSGNIYVQAGSTLTIFNGGAAIPFGANTNIYNYGNIIFRVSIVTGPSNTLFNCTASSSFTVPFDQFVLQGPNTFFINNGQMQSSFFIVQSTNAANCVCLGSGSVITTNTIINQFNNAFNVPVGAACINVLQNVINSASVSATSSLLVCLAPGINIISGPNWGSAVVSANCPSCSVPLPVELLYFSGYNDQRSNVLNWSTASELNNCHFVLQRSEDCISFSDITQMEGGINSNTVLSYSFNDDNVEFNQMYYYRLKQVDCNGDSHFSNIIILTAVYDPDNNWIIWPNPSHSTVHIQGAAGISSLQLFNSIGQEIKTNWNNDELFMNEILPGTYYIRITPANGVPVVKKLIRD
jgi:hypothetical protein